MKRNLYFRVDASPKIGRGHLSRCLALAEMLKNDFNIQFVFEKSNLDFVETLDLNYAIIPVNRNSEIFELAGLHDLVWLDGYNFTESFKSQLRQNIYRLIETNDTPYEAKHVDLIFNHTPGITKEQFGHTTANLCLGLDYAMLRPAFLDYTKSHREIELTGQGVFICFGGADTFNLGKKFVNKLIQQNISEPIYWVSNEISKEEYSNCQSLEILYNLSETEMIDYMLKSKVMLIPSSVLSLEAIALRKPFFTGYFVNNQKLIYQGLKTLELAECFGYLEKDYHVEQATLQFLDFFKNETRQADLIKSQRQHLSAHSPHYVKEAVLNI